MLNVNVKPKDYPDGLVNGEGLEVNEVNDIKKRVQVGKEGGQW